MSNSDKTSSRRTFLAAGVSATAATALPAASYARVCGANERIGVGFIGYGLIGKRHVLDFQEQPDVNMVAVSDAHRGRVEEAKSLIGDSGAKVRGYRDFRELLDDADVDAVCIATPDHWHALMTMLACAAGKDVYVEKPLTLFVREGRWMLDVAKKHQRVVQVGTQQRSGEHYQRARDLVRDGHIGRVMSVRMAAARNVMPGFGDPPDGDPPPDLDYDLWLGPAPKRPYNPNRSIYHFRWFWDYSGGQMTNLGQHSLDIVDWFLGMETLRSVTSSGGRFCLTDSGETPDTMDVLFEFDGWTATWSHREASAGRRDASPQFFGTKGNLGISRRGFRVEADADVPPELAIPQFAGAHPVGGPQPHPEGTRFDRSERRYRTEPVVDQTGDDRQQFKDHVRNFLDCVKSRKTPLSDLASGHRVATACHLANLSLKLGRQIEWDAASESVRNDSDANGMLVRQYRAPWDRELAALGVA
jgi:predicted dehydrogenase